MINKKITCTYVPVVVFDIFAIFDLPSNVERPIVSLFFEIAQL